MGKVFLEKVPGIFKRAYLYQVGQWTKQCNYVILEFVKIISNESE